MALSWTIWHSASKARYQLGTPGVYAWNDIDLADGTLAVELNSSDNGNRSVAIRTLGTIGLTTGGQVNRDGIGAVVSFIPH